jgi:hypothetical protein
MGNQEWTIQRNWQNWACKTQEEDKNKNKKTHTRSTSLKEYWLQSRNVLNKHSELMLKYYWLQSGKCEKNIDSYKSYDKVHFSFSFEWFPYFCSFVLVAFTATKYYDKIHFYLNALNKHSEFMLKFYWLQSVTC